jgi:outer membrane lipoprotein-sorting protein
VNILRRLPLSRLLLLCGVIVVAGISITAIASAGGSGPTPPAKPLAQAVHDVQGAPAVQGVSANIKLTNHLLEGASLASGGGQGGELASSPLINGGSGRLWISSDGRVRLELQAEKGDTQVISDGNSVSIYDGASNTLYRYTPPAGTATGMTHAPKDTGTHQPATVAQIQEEITMISAHANLSGAQPTDVAGHAAYTVRITPKEGGSLIGGAELSFDASNGAPLRAAIYSSTSPAPVIELAATELSYGPVDPSVFSFAPPANAKIVEIVPPTAATATHKTSATGQEKPQVTTYGKGLSTVAVVKSKAGKGSAGQLESLPKVTIGSSTASELKTALGTILTFERSGVRYVIAGSVTPAAIEAIARGL